MAKEKGLSIFILDDTLIDQKTIKEFLTNFAFKNIKRINIIESYSLVEAQDKLTVQKDKIDLFVLDGQLDPEKKTFGFDLIPTIQKTNPTAKIIMCSGNTELNIKGVMSGADMSIPKGELGMDKSKSTQEDFGKELKDLLNQ